MQEATESSLGFDFRKDFSDLAAPGLRRYLRECGFDPDPTPDGLDDCWSTGQVYAIGLWRLLKWEQETALDSPWGAEEARKVASGYEIDTTVARKESGSGDCESDIGLYRAMGLVRPTPDPELRSALEDAARKAADDFEIRRAAWHAERQAISGEPDAEAVARKTPLESAGGLLQQTAEWILSASIIPCEELSLLAALGAMSAFMGRRYIGPTGLAPNLYLVGLAKTGSGKNGPLSALRRLLLGSPFMGGDDLVSDTVIERTVREQPVCVCPMDEIGAWLQEAARRNAPAHVQGRRKMLLKLYSESADGGIFLGRDHAGDEKRSSTNPVLSPCFSIFGVSTEALFFRGITEENTVDGFLNRLTVMRIPEIDEPDELPDVELSVPSDLRQALDDAFDAWPVRDVLARSAYKLAIAEPTMHQVPWANAEAKDAYTAVRRAQKAMVKTDPENEGIYRRRGEQAMKIAMIRAVSRDFATPSVTAEDVRYGDAIIERSCEMLAAGIRENMSGSEFEANWKLLLKHVEAADENGLSATKLLVKPGVSKIETRKFNDAVKYLTRTGKWEPREHPKKKGQYRYIKLGGRTAVFE